MNHDVIKDKYGRLYYLPYELAERGHKISGICLDYYGSEESPFRASDEPLTWYSFNAGKAGWKIPQYMIHLIQAIRSQRPALLIGASDTLHVALTRIVGNLTGTPYLIDLYDNFESFALSKVPFMKTAYRWSLRGATGISTVSAALRNRIQRQVTCPVVTIESTIATGTFFPMEKAAAREALHLPSKGVFIGTAGSLAKDRGTDILYKAFSLLADKISDLYLVLAGPLHGNTIPHHPNVIYLGELSHKKIPYFFNALDVSVICMKNTDFGRYAFPQKLYEIVASKVPVVAARVGAIKSLLCKYPEILYPPDSLDDMVKILHEQIRRPKVPAINPPTWTDQAKKIDLFITSLLEQKEGVDHKNGHLV